MSPSQAAFSPFRLNLTYKQCKQRRSDFTNQCLKNKTHDNNTEVQSEVKSDSI